MADRAEIPHGVACDLETDATLRDNGAIMSLGNASDLSLTWCAQPLGIYSQYFFS